MLLSGFLVRLKIYFLVLCTFVYLRIKCLERNDFFFVYLFTLAKRPLFCNLKKRDFGNNEDTHSVDNEN